MPNSYGEILTARGGTYILNDTSTYNTSLVYAIVTLEDTEFSILEITDSNGIVTDVINDHFADLLTPIKAGAIITPMDVSKPFSSIELASGSVTLVLK
jgi:hypothetical protein